MQPEVARTWSRWLGLLVGAVLVILPGQLHPSSDDPPAGFVWEDLKEIHARMLRPQNWLVRSGLKGAPPFESLRPGTAGGPPYEFSPQPFDGISLEAGLWVSAHPKVGMSATRSAVEMQAEMLGKNAALRSWTKQGMPVNGCTARGVFFINNQEGDKNCMYESIFIVNEATDTFYIVTVKAPRDRWKEVEAVGDTMLANLRLDPEF